MTIKVNPIAQNQTEVTTGKGNVVFFSYKTAVAAYVPGKGYYKTSQHYSVTTSNHVGMWLRSNGATPEKVEKVDPAFFDTL